MKEQIDGWREGGKKVLRNEQTDLREEKKGALPYIVKGYHGDARDR
jgi:hypothetical protein